MSLDARVGIVLVSHSAALAEGAAELAAQVSGGTVAIIPAGGTDDGGLGTSSAKVERAVKLADRGAGVLILPDLGSAVLTVRVLLGDPDDLPSAGGTGRCAVRGGRGRGHRGRGRRRGHQAVRGAAEEARMPAKL